MLRFHVKSFEKEAQNATLDLMSDDKDIVCNNSVKQKWYVRDLLHRDGCKKLCFSHEIDLLFDF